ncbi:MAG: hypothetical protein PHO08_19965, partial [Methylococcales bacterium]|nr:hypothetical protein [Methylococcales bacterium]
AKVEKLPNRKVLLEDPVATLVIDVSEQPIERPVKNQKAYYSGKKRHTVKAQQHDFSVFKDPPLVAPRCLAAGGFGIPGAGQTPSELVSAGQKEKRPIPFGRRQSL